MGDATTMAAEPSATDPPKPMAAAEPSDAAPVLSPTPAPTIPAPPESAMPTMALSLLLPLLLIILYFFLGKKSGGRGGAQLLLFGPVGGGKTALYHRLKHGRVVPTASSMEPSSSSFVPCAPSGAEAAPSAPVRVCDMPGSGRLRARLKAEASNSACLVCVIDGTQLAAQAREAAGMLFDVFAQDSVARRPPPLLVAVNKLDLPGCAAPAVAKKALEQEVQRVRLARTSMEDTAGKSGGVRGIADDASGPFTFDQLGCAVSFANLSAVKPELSAVLAFAAQRAR